MSSIATCHVPTRISNASRAEDAYWTAGDAMEMPIAKMAAMKIQVFAVSFGFDSNASLLNENSIF